MALWSLFIFALLFGLLPLGMGNALVRSKSLPLTFAGGLFTGFALFWGLALVFHAALGSLRLMTALWLVLCLGLALWGGLRWRRGEHPIRRPGPAWTSAQRLLLAVIAVLVLLHILNTVLNTRYGNWDDETYISMATTSVLTDTANRFSPHSGRLLPAFYVRQYDIVPWPLYSAMLTLLTGIHSAILFRTVLPVFEILLFYFVIWQLLRCFWHGERGKMLLSLFYFQLFTALTAGHLDHIGTEWWFAVEIWTGKALAGAILVPLVLWMLILLDGKAPDAEEHCAVWRALLPVCWGCCLFSSTMFFLLAAELLLWGGLYLLRTRRWKETVNFAVCGLPAAVCMFFMFH